MHSLITITEENAYKKWILRYKCAILNALEVEKYIRRRRGWIFVERDEWEAYDSFWARHVVENLGMPSREELEGAYREARVGRGPQGEEELGTVWRMGSSAVGFWD